MRVGTVCYATSRGLGHLARSFHQHGVVTDVFVIRHPSIPMNEDWYPNAPSTDARRPDRAALYDFAKDMDALLFFETPFEWSLLDFCRAKGIRTYIISMYECTPARLPARPTKWLCPSLLDMRYFPKESSVFLPLPVEMPWRLRERARSYVHNGGYLGLRGREGTTLLIEAMELVKNPIQLRLRVQENVRPEYRSRAERNPLITYEAGTFPYETMHSWGDVYVAPQKFNGCSLPLQEAFASGMLCISTDRFPMNTWLPKEPLIPVSRYERCRVGGPYNEIEEAIITPKAIAETMDRWYDRDISDWSRAGQRWAQSVSWDVLKPQYLKAMED
jgi:hypothetical protein